jgi:hypothetical protein
MNAPRALLGAMLPFLREIAVEDRRPAPCATIEALSAHLVAYASLEALETR